MHLIGEIKLPPLTFLCVNLFSQIEQSHKKALEIISIIGCSISLLAVIVTMVVTVFFWRAVKSPRAKVLLNLCAAIAICCILVIAEGSARNNEVCSMKMVTFTHSN